VTTLANLKFLANLNEPLVYIPSKGGGDETEHVGNFVSQQVSVHDGRREKADSSLDAEGFSLVHQASSVKNFYDDAEISTTYHDEVLTLLMTLTGANRVEIFDDTRRATSLEQQRKEGIREPAAIVHNDYTARSGVKRLKDHFVGRENEAEELLHRPFAIVNVWRSIGGTIYNHPLTLCDATTVKPGDLVSMERRADDRIGELQVALFDPEQRWYYFPEMRMDEALLFKTFDSETDGRTRFTVHSSFDDPNAAPDAPDRESIETRCLLFF
jgi:hypothetical protein